MRTYETTFIINPQADDATLDKQVTSITDLIKSNGGNILCENRIGTRRLAYEIAGLSQGYYTQLFFEAPQGALPVLDRFFKLEDPYVRFMTVTFEGTVPSPEDLNRSVDDDRDDRDHRDHRDHRDEDDDDDNGRGRRRNFGRRDERPDSRKSDSVRSEEAPKVKASETEAPAEAASQKPVAEAKPVEEKPAEKAEEPKASPSEDEIL